LKDEQPPAIVLKKTLVTARRFFDSYIYFSSIFFCFAYGPASRSDPTFVFLFLGQVVEEHLSCASLVFLFYLRPRPLPLPSLPVFYTR